MKKHVFKKLKGVKNKKEREILAKLVTDTAAAATTADSFSLPRISWDDEVFCPTYAHMCVLHRWRRTP